MKKIKYIIITILIFNCHYASAKNNRNYIKKTVQKINKEIKLYIETERKDQIASGKYAVYVANLYLTDFSNKKICLTIGSISNSYELPYVHSDYIYYSGEEIVLLRINENVDSNIINNFQYKKFSENDSIKVINKLIPIKEGQIISDAGYLSLCINKNKITKMINDDSQIPINQSIFKNDIEYDMERVK